MLLSGEGHLKLVDFGIAKIIETNGMHTFCGTAEYLAPELVANTAYGKGVDFWAFGCIIYEFFVGTSPFYSKSMPITCQKIMDRDIYWPPDLPADAKDLVNKLLEKDITKRLGCGTDGGQSIRKHKFFEGINFNELNKTSPPLIPDELDKEVRGVGLNLSAEVDVITNDDEITMMASNVSIHILRSENNDLNPQCTDRVKRQQILQKLYPPLAKLPPRPAHVSPLYTEVLPLRSKTPTKSESSPKSPASSPLYSSSPFQSNSITNSDEFSLNNIQMVTNLQGPVRRLAWTEYGDQFAASSNFLMNSFKLSTGQRDNLLIENLSTIDTGSTARYLEYSAGGEYLAVDLQRQIGIINKGKYDVMKPLTGHGKPITTVSWQKSSDEAKIVAGGLESCVYIWNVKKIKLLSAIRSNHFHNGVSVVSWQPKKGGGNIIAAGGDDGVLLLYDANTEKENRRIIQHERTLQGVAWRDENIFATWSSDRVLRISDVGAKESIKTCAFPAPIKNFVWSANGKHFATIGNDMIRLWSFPDIKLIRSFHGDRGIDSSLITFDRESTLLAFTTDNEDVIPIVYDIIANTVIETSPKDVVRTHKGPITALSWSPTKPILASGSVDRTVQFWTCEEMKIENLDGATKFFQEVADDESDE